VAVMAALRTKKNPARARLQMATNLTRISRWLVVARCPGDSLRAQRDGAAGE